MNGRLRRAPASVVLLCGFLLLLSPPAVWPQNPNSGVTSTGQVLTVNITAPIDQSLLTGSAECRTLVQGLVALSPVEAPRISVLYVLDLSGSTGDPTNLPPIDVNGDGVIDSRDDFNGDGATGDVLDAEIAAAIALNASIDDLAEVSAGVLGYASRAVAADMRPEIGVQLFSARPLADENGDGTPDVEEVLRSMDSDPRFGGAIGKFTPVDPNLLGNSTNFETALQIALQTLATRPAGEHKIVFFLSDGDNRGGGDLADEIQAAATAGIVINTLGITNQADPGDLSRMAAGTGGTFTQVDDPSRLSAEITAIRPVGIAQVDVNGSAVQLTPVGTFSTETSVLAGGANILATARADDSTKVTAGIGVVCADTNLTCTVDILTPQNGEIACGDSVEIVAVSRVVGGVPPISRSWFVNGTAASVTGDTLRTQIALALSPLPIEITVTYEDALGSRTSCTDSAAVEKARPPQSRVKITSPGMKQQVCGDSVRVTARVTVEARQPATLNCEINGLPVEMAADSTLLATVALTGEATAVFARCQVEDSCGLRSAAQDSITVLSPPAPVCSLEIISPENGATVCGDSVTVALQTSSRDSAALVTASAKINGQEALPGPGGLVARVPVPDDGRLLATYTVTDSCGRISTCSDSVTVSRPAPPKFSVDIVSPRTGLIVCADSVLVSVLASVETGGPAQVDCNISGVPAVPADSTFSALVPLSSGQNRLVAACTATDSCGNQFALMDTVKVRLDDRPPYCKFEHDGNRVTGTFYDPHSGIATVEEVELRNAALTVAHFSPGSRKVNFSIDPIDPGQSIFFSIDVTDGCGNVFNCDPVFVSLSQASGVSQHTVSFPAVDRYLEIENHGLERISVTLNGQRFRLLAESEEAGTAFNAFPIPRFGRAIFDLQPALLESNQMQIEFSGDASAFAQVKLSGEASFVDYLLDLEPVPRQFHLAQNYPNPFNPTTKIQYDIPADRQAGVAVKLTIYNLLGGRVQVLVDGKKMPGRYVAEWDGKNSRGKVVSSGIYVYRLQAGEFTETRRMLLLR